MKTRTMQEWFKDLPPSYRDSALRNLSDSNWRKSNEMCSTLKDALRLGFLWQSTEEGYIFWAELYNLLENEAYIHNNIFMDNK